MWGPNHQLQRLYHLGRLVVREIRTPWPDQKGKALSFGMAAAFRGRNGMIKVSIPAIKPALFESKNQTIWTSDRALPSFLSVGCDWQAIEPAEMVEWSMLEKLISLGAIGPSVFQRLLWRSYSLDQYPSFSFLWRSQLVPTLLLPSDSKVEQCLYNRYWGFHRLVVHHRNNAIFQRALG